ncbi:hypothetical protein F4821DRAFT_279980 [Hypoxylon rubiginosum]|uniref:Uncharacterized protein n=1 Tax=Hypoxylon rubiginosum TaxID=110542 RepID=A0ACC0CVR1_9PEZI|nr:hypothetical protein F4821DRAFT_279980 [Hypoxylon rubiginosum]
MDPQSAGHAHPQTTPAMDGVEGVVSSDGRFRCTALLPDGKQCTSRVKNTKKDIGSHYYKRHTASSSYARGQDSSSTQGYSCPNCEDEGKSWKGKNWNVVFSHQTKEHDRKVNWTIPTDPETLAAGPQDRGVPRSNGPPAQLPPPVPALLPPPVPALLPPPIAAPSLAPVSGPSPALVRSPSPASPDEDDLDEYETRHPLPRFRGERRAPIRVRRRRV